MAEAWKSSGDGKVVTFTLKKNDAFQDGAPVTAKSAAIPQIKHRLNGRTIAAFITGSIFHKK
ncbi:ABC transporter substrate-binding protein [Acerihabitans arboris]|uniref:ABC transporter substrate-binding protein n=1 Tax=Acerihabitans arboris TaxID=2691583 RepID=UPI0035E42BCF